ncbi:hypothetical protein DJ71_20410 [Halorubrum sp. E3]|nr:hypothetical protein DJ71_20410 [Halorubrum sp. E3]
MPVTVHSAPATGSVPGRVFAIVEEGDDTVQAIYEFTVDGATDELELTHAIPELSEDVDEEVPESVEESLAASGYTLSDDPVAKTDGGVDDRVETLRLALQSAKDAEPGARDEFIKDALGEAVDLRAAGITGSGDLQEQLNNVLVSPDEEAPYFINRALSRVEDIDDRLGAGDGPAPGVDDTQEEPPTSVRWVGEDRGVLELELTRPMIEWIEHEVDDSDSDSIEDWVRTQIWIQLTSDLRENHGFDTTVDVDVPRDFAHRASLWWRDRQLRGGAEPADLEAFLFNHVGFSPSYTVEGEPWSITEGFEEGDDVN